MELTNYWWILIWLIVVGGGISLMNAKEPVQILGKKEYRWSWASVIIVAFPYAIWAMNRKSFGDTEMYRKTFHEAPSVLSQIPIYLSAHTKDQGFSVLTIIIKSLIGNSDKFFFLLIAVFQMLCVVYFFRKYSSDFLLSLFMFIASTDYLSWMFNGVRQFCAVCLILLCFGMILEKKYYPAIAVILLASTIHGSALIMIPIIFVIQGKAWNKKTLLMLAGVIVAVLLIDQFTSVLDNLLSETQYSDMITNEIWTTDDGTNIFRILFYSIPAILSLVGKRYIDEANSPMINMCVNCAAVTAFSYILAGASSGIYIGRIPIYTTLPGYVAVPWLLDHMFTKNSARLVKIFLIFGYVAFFYYQTHITWGII